VSFGVWFAFAFSSLLTAATLALSWKFRNEKQVPASSLYDIPVLLEGEGIRFPKRYFFRTAAFQKPGFVPVSAISEVHIVTNPASFIINHNEVLFVRFDQKEALQEFAKRHNIPVSERLDIWESICDPYLNTTFDDTETQRTMDRLEANGIPPHETDDIRRKIRFTMMNNEMAWEWVYLVQFDYLRWGFGSVKRYWWSMEIALRN